MSRTRPYLGRGLTIFRFMSVPPVSTSTCPPVALSIRRLVHPQTCLCEPGPSATIATRLCLSAYSLIMGEPSLRSQVVIASSPDRQLQPGGEMPARPSDQSMRERIVAAAIQVIRERGVTHATTREIARAAKVSEGIIYNHFENKTALFGAAFGAVTGGIRGAMREAADSVGSGTVEGNLERLAATAIRFYGELLPMTGSALADHDVSAWLRRRRPGASGARPILPSSPPPCSAPASSTPSCRCWPSPPHSLPSACPPTSTSTPAAPSGPSWPATSPDVARSLPRPPARPGQAAHLP